MSRRAYLFLEADRRVFRCQFTKDLTIIGSASDADIIIKDPTVLGHHAQIGRTGDAYLLRRIDRSEVRIDGERIDAPHELVSGERIGIGDTDILFVREQAESPTTVQLLVQRTGEPVLGFWTAKSTITLGRERGDIIIDDPLISRVHCIIENYCAGGQFLLDARSDGGTALNGVAIDTRYRLIDGDVIAIGGVKLIFHTGVPSAARPGASGAAAPTFDRAHALRVDPELARNDRVGQGESPLARNPYQRYPSQIPGAARDEAPRRASVDLRSGVTTGITDPAAVRAARDKARARDGATPAPRPGPGSSGPALSGRPDPAAAARAAPVQEDRPAALPNFKPRAGWGDPGAAGAPRGRSFDDDVSTRISHVGNDLNKGEGLWYMPRDGGGAGAGPGVTPSAGPIRGGQNDDARAPARPLIRRPEAGALRPMAAAPPVEAPRPAPVPEPVARRAPLPAGGPGASSTRAPEERPSPARPPEAPGGRSDGRWYHPDQAAPRPPGKRVGDPLYYLPERKPPEPGEEESTDRLRSEFRRPKFGGKTQGFDPSDY